MEQFKEFQGKDLDECISQACAFFDTPREKLEIEIIQDAKSGIFGIVGARKAKIRARNAHLKETVQQLLEPQKQQHTPVSKNLNKNLKDAGEHKNKFNRENSKNPENEINKESCKDLTQDAASENIKQSSKIINKTINKDNANKDKKYPAEQDVSDKITGDENNESKSGKEASRPGGNKKTRFQRFKNRENGINKGNRRGRRPNKNNSLNPAAKRHNEDNLSPHASDSWPVVPLDQLDNERLAILAEESVLQLITPMSESDVPVEVALGHGTVRVKIDWQGDAGILIGKEGQTLSAIQYLAGRIISKAMQASIRVQLEIGDYKSRQDDHLREIAKSLAEKARQTGRSWSTRPLSSYHRRIIHMTLQNEGGILTRSAGEGALKRVIISPKRD